MFTMITEWNVNDRVRITNVTFQNIWNSSRSIFHFPDSRFVSIAERLMKNGIKGTVTTRWFPGYEVNVTFDDGTILQVKDHWIESVVGESVLENGR